MHRFKMFLLFLLLINILFLQKGNDQKALSYRTEYDKYDKIYRDAGKLTFRSDYNEKTEQLEVQMNRQALMGFLKILPEIEKDRNDSIAFHCYFKIGVLEHYFDSLPAAHKAYLKAISLKTKLSYLPDSFLFRAYLFSGNIYYSSSQFDLAMNDYKKAEKIGEEYKNPLGESNRLFNTLGALYYETGNYRQAKNYFEKAISIMRPDVPFYRSLIVNYKINLASTLTKLEEYDEANTIYQSLLPLNINRNEILHNIGTINLNLGASVQAIKYFTQVHYNTDKNIKLYNDIGLAYFNLDSIDSAKIFYDKALTENEKWNHRIKNVAHGQTLKYVGDWLTESNEFERAAEKYQQAIIQFDDGFDKADIYKNPEQYSGVFSYINLFNTLTAKADALEKSYQQKKNIEVLEASLDAYRSAFKLADYVEKTYDSDEARLFLNRIKYTVHSKPIDISLLLYQITSQKKFLEEAYLFDQRNKASILSLNVQENEIRKSLNIKNELFNEESSVRSAITRLSLKASQIKDSSQIQQLNASIRDYEIRLGKIQEKISDDLSYREKEFTEDIPTIQQLQKMLSNTTVVVSYHLSDTSMLLLLIAKNKFGYSQVAINNDFFARLDSFKSALHEVSSEKKYNGEKLSNYLYQMLIAPVRSDLTGFDRLIIIPDDELNYLPFEALQDENKKYLIEKFSIQYQYSTSLLKSKRSVKKPENVLAFAPFTSSSFSDTTGLTLEKLPGSKNEVGNLSGKIFMNDLATKNNFIRLANHFEIIHLATHAIVNNEQPLNSFIAFYPGNNNSDDYKLYAPEIYNMDLDSTELVILSACETGTGKLVRGEGLMSLSRAFAYAGCPNIITSLWKAEDKATAFITQRLHVYLNKGLVKDKALQQAKLDLLKDVNIDPRFKTPNYWAHLIFIGDHEFYHSSSNWWWIAIGIILITAVFIYLRRKSLSISEQA